MSNRADGREDPPDRIRRSHDRLVQQPHVLNTGLHRQIRQHGCQSGTSQHPWRFTDQIRVQALCRSPCAHRSSNLSVERARSVAAFRASRVSMTAGSPWLSRLSVSPCEATAIVYQHSSSFEVTGRNDASRLAHGIRPPE